jgi:hypothetical protein
MMFARQAVRRGIGQHGADDAAQRLLGEKIVSYVVHAGISNQESEISHQEDQERSRSPEASGRSPRA